MEMLDMLATMVDRQASDLFITVGAAPTIKVEGLTETIDDEILDEERVRGLVDSIVNDEQARNFERELELNMALHVPGVGRFRVNVFNQRGAPAIVSRHIKDKIPTVTQLGLPEKLNDLIMEQRGLLLVVGGTGTGKSTTLAAMISHRAKSRGGHILCIEDPIEFVHDHSTALVNQREVGIDTHSYAIALKNALREAPNVIMIGEIRDADTMQHALTYAETGHLCVATLHANNANQALDRILNFFPETAHHQILLDLSLHLKAIISQRLCIGLDNKRVASMEMMINTGHVADLIGKGKLGAIKEAMSRSKGRVHKTFDLDLYELYAAGKISEEEALRHADSRNNLALQIRLNRDKVNVERPIDKEVSFNRRAPFEQYTSFSLAPLQISKKRREDAARVIQKAMLNAFIGKGLEYDAEDAEIEVQYSFGVQDAGGLKLEIIDHESDELHDVEEDTDQELSLVVNVKDRRFNRDVWRMQAKQTVDADAPALTQDEINAIVVQLVEDYPQLG